MRCSTLALSLAITYALAVSASPAPENTVVPEDDLSALDEDLVEAQQKINEMTVAGASDKDCRKLATETRKDVTANVNNCQKTIDAMPNGEHCMNLGQDSVKTATEAKSKADKHVVYCSTLVTKAASSSVQFGSRTFSSLTEGKCESFYSSTSYTTAEAKYNAAVTTLTRAKGAAGEAANALKTAIANAESLKHKCLCKTRSDHKKALADGSKSNAANEKAWSFACKVECVLDKKTQCTCPAAPKCKAAKLTNAVYAEAGKCAAAAKTCSSCDAVPCGYCQEGCPPSKCSPAKFGPWKGKKPFATSRNGCATKHGIKNWKQTPPGCNVHCDCAKVPCGYCQEGCPPSTSECKVVEGHDRARHSGKHGKGTKNDCSVGNAGYVPPSCNSYSSGYDSE